MTRTVQRRNGFAKVWVGIDQSYSGFGLTLLFAPDGRGHDTVVTSFKDSGVDRLLDIKGWLMKVMGRWDVQHVCMEGYAPGAKFGLEMAGELGCVVKMALRESLPEPVGYPTVVSPHQLTKFVTGKGQGAKDNMLLEVYKRWGVEFPAIASGQRNNAADSYGLAQIARALSSEGTTITTFQREVLENLKRHTEWTQTPRGGPLPLSSC